jgi:hypothetical protein
MPATQTTLPLPEKKKAQQNLSPFGFRVKQIMKSLKKPDGSPLIQEEFCKENNFRSSAISKIISGEKVKNERFVKLLMFKYNVNHLFLYNGKLPMFNKEEPKSSGLYDVKELIQANQFLQKRIEVFQDTINDLYERNRKLEEKVNNLIREVQDLKR